MNAPALTSTAPGLTLDDVRAAAADHAAKAAEIVLRSETQGQSGAQLIAQEIAGLKSRLN